MSVWQIGVTAPILWLLWLIGRQRRLPTLGHGLDWIAGLAVLGWVLSAAQAGVPQQAYWHTCTALGFLAALYALRLTVQSPEQRDRLLTVQGSLNLAFILVSLGLWVQQTWLPELARLRELQQAGIDLTFSFVVLEVRNWAPTGHPNYVAGYLLLALPLLAGLGFVRFGWQRWLWWSGLGLGLLDLYTTSSRMALLGLAVAVTIALLLLAAQRLLPRHWVGVSGLGAIALLGLMTVTNTRLRALIAAALTGQAGSESAYRVITGLAGWGMVQDHPWLGAGLGSVPWLYQRYRPDWAGREAEQVYQLHNTPLQIWAELGLWGCLSLGGAIALLLWLGWRWIRWADAGRAAQSDRIYVVGLYSGLGAYGVMSLTDYQLDNPSISGSLVVAIACLLSLFREAWPTSDPSHHPRYSRRLAAVGLGVWLAMTLGLIPIHQAWNFSSQGFTALAQQNFARFEQLLTQAHRLVPWDPYYPQQLAWNLGDRAVQSGDPLQRQASMTWFETSIQTAPALEFSYTNLAWLQLTANPAAASRTFAQAAQLIPAKRGLWYGLGLSLLARGQSDLALEALTLETLIDPLFISSPLWQFPPLQSLYPQVLAGMETTYTMLLQQTQDPRLRNRLHALRGGLFWWQGNLAATRQDWQISSTPLGQLVLDLADGKDGKEIQAHLRTLAPATGLAPFGAGAPFVVAAWMDPANRPALLQKGWAIGTRRAIAPSLLAALETSMARASSFDQWLKQTAPTRQYRRERSGFGVLSRHVDGPAPVDFPTILENIPMVDLFSELLPSTTYSPELDRRVQARREQLIQQVLKD